MKGQDNVVIGQTFNDKGEPSDLTYTHPYV